MDREHFIIAVYCLVCQVCQQLRTKHPQLKRRGGFDPALTEDEEVITIEVCGEYFKLLPTRTSSTTSARTGATSSPTWGRELCSCGKRLTCGRSKPLFTSTWFRSVAGQDAVQIIDTMPLPVCTYTGASGIAASSRLPIMGTARPSR
jgi:hypothetical protein